MVLTKKYITQMLKSGELAFTPNLDKFQVQPHAIDLRLGFDFHLPKSWELTEKGRVALHIDPLEKDTHNFKQIHLKEGQYFELLPSEYIVATTLEKIELSANNIMGVLYPRSSITRRGLALNLTGVIDARYKGYLMIPIMNNTDNQIIRVYPGERICSVVFQLLSSPLSEKEANLHGLQKARFNDASKVFIGSKTDKQTEINLIRYGKLEEIKKKYRFL